MRSPLYDYGRPEEQPNVYTPEMGTETAYEPPVQPAGQIPVTYGGNFSFTPAKESEEVRIRRKIDKATVVERDKKRAISNNALPIILDDYAKTVQHMEQVNQSLEQARKAIEQPFERPQLGMNDAIAAGISGIFGGAQGFNQALGGAYERSDQDYAQNFQMQRQNAMLDYERAVQEVDFSRRKMDGLRNAYLQAIESGDEFERRIALEEMRAENDRQQMLEQHRQRLELEGTKSQGRISLEQAKREGKLDPATVNFWKMLLQNTDPEGRSVVVSNAMARMGMSEPPNELLEAVQQLTIQEQNVQARTQTEDATRAGKVANLNAGASLKISQMFLNDARRGQIEQRVAYYPQEFQAKIANTYSLIDQRTRGKVGGGENYYYGKGDETAIRSGMNSANKTIAALMMKASTSGGVLTPEDAAALKTAQEDSALFSRELQKVQKAKTDRVRTKYSGQGIDTGGGFAPFKPDVPAGVNAFSGAKASGGGDKKKSAPKKTPKKPKFEFIED